MSIEKFLFNGTEQAVSKTAFAGDVTDELYPRTVVKFSGDTDSDNAECNITFEEVAAAYARGSNLIMIHEYVYAKTGEVFVTEFPQARFLNSDGSLRSICGTAVDASGMFAGPSTYYPHDMYIEYSADHLRIVYKDEGESIPDISAT